MFSKTCEYAIRAMIFLAQKSVGGKRIGIKEIAKGSGAPEYFIAKVMQNLCREGLVQSMKGPRGGFYLSEQNAQCSIADIVRAVDGDAIFTACGLGLHQCSEANPCPIHHEYKGIREATNRMLESAQLTSFKDELDNQKSFLKLH